MFNPEILKKALLKIRDLFFKGGDITDDEILNKKIEDLIDVSTSMPVNPLYDELALRLSTCISFKIDEFNGDFIKARKDKSVSYIIDYLDGAEQSQKISFKQRSK